MPPPFSPAPKRDADPGGRNDGGAGEDFAEAATQTAEALSRQPLVNGLVSAAIIVAGLFTFLSLIHI